jgi:indole-3-glycerol phosphate synthase
MNILDEIIQHKYKEVASLKSRHPVKELEKSIYFQTPTTSMKAGIRDKNKSGIIAEIKRKSPSKGVINAQVFVEQIASGYFNAGVSAISVLTDSEFFGGSNEDLRLARKSNQGSILRKEFIIDEYQIVEAKSIGADAILLIAAVLSPDQIKQFTAFAHSFGLEVLLEIHSLEELYPNLFVEVDMIGVNNRDLKTFTLSLEVSKKLAPFIPETFVKVSESGIESPEAIMELRKYGYEGFLMGQSFMQNSNPEKACLEFVTRLNQLKAEV